MLSKINFNKILAIIPYYSQNKDYTKIVYADGCIRNYPDTILEYVKTLAHQRHVKVPDVGTIIKFSAISDKLVQIDYLNTFLPFKVRDVRNKDDLELGLFNVNLFADGSFFNEEKEKTMIDFFPSEEYKATLVEKLEQLNKPVRLYAPITNVLDSFERGYRLNEQFRDAMSY